jgi:hypothetical protein
VSIPTTNYNVFVVSEEFIKDTECRNCTAADQSVIPTAEILKDLWRKSRNGLLDKLTPADCVDAYSTLIQSTRSNLLVVTARKSPSPRPIAGLYSLDDSYINSTDVYLIRNSDAVERLNQYQGNDPLAWLCSGLPGKRDIACQMRLGELKDISQPWELSAGCSGDPSYCNQYRWPVSHCLSERPKTLCRLHFSSIVASIVTALNLCKSYDVFV